ncbi:POTRA domain-containing protein [Rhodothermus marinus]|uniref:POTRA domain-containing protein n=1 Tax=Rhodothermus marinus TaxID=29549 RepID=UPI0034E2DD86
MNRGYMLFRAEPTIRVVGRDSLDLHFDVYEGDVFEFGTINIAGNQKTKEHVIRRELYTIPGQTFSAMPSRSRSDAWRSSTTSTRKRWRPVPRCRSIRRKRRSI